MRASQWELVEQLIPVLQPLAKATEVMCGELHIGLCFICPVIFSVINTTLCVTGQESDLGFIRAFKNAVQRQLETRFKLESDGLAESIPIVACMLDPRFKHLQFIPESMREDASDHLNRLLRDKREPPVATGRSSDTIENLFGAIYLTLGALSCIRRK